MMLPRRLLPQMTLPPLYALYLDKKAWDLDVESCKSRKVNAEADYGVIPTHRLRRNNSNSEQICYPTQHYGVTSRQGYAVTTIKPGREIHTSASLRRNTSPRLRRDMSLFQEATREAIGASSLLTGAILRELFVTILLFPLNFNYLDKQVFGQKAQDLDNGKLESPRKVTRGINIYDGVIPTHRLRRNTLKVELSQQGTLWRNTSSTVTAVPDKFTETVEVTVNPSTLLSP
ncbi:hypothetical protein Tco_0117222 [Tanacetum coccineum]